MTFTGLELTWIVVCYFLGCFTVGYYWVRWQTGGDLRRQGSGNVGARNVGRFYGGTGFAVTLLGDLVKGMVAVGVTRWLEMDPYVVTGALLAVVIGHIWPFQLKFRGGKGAAVSLGALLVYDPFIPLVMLCLLAPAYLLIRSFTLAGMLAYCLAPLTVFLVGLGPWDTFAISAISVLVLAAHRGNIRQELSGLWSDRSAKQAVDHSPD